MNLKFNFNSLTLYRARRGAFWRYCQLPLLWVVFNILSLFLHLHYIFTYIAVGGGCCCKDAGCKQPICYLTFTLLLINAGNDPPLFEITLLICIVIYLISTTMGLCSMKYNLTLFNCTREMTIYVEPNLIYHH